ncbi:DNA polymerase subunit gamma-2, mitochondrial precursor [Xenopus laevis]|uniref:DNA polymerase subunit gamma-2, mitochondrial n=3 Tax=Xenopus laevis TaxID=8355 RepID=DPOG2_XENLA|nr:DNA polymerase subunit gamma-2, mitochondrial precursor [Xenopus laevis]Q9W6G7.1 RecName: Full=DNA polymerase subunit gamma-2, mitochondrial; AltName: Full=Mitochondrial DNA polymerase accessory subunit; AltName: Full=MtPolB; AltName: Full=PolG-beta; Flags: Precursor [Xenopus laevis]AAD32572.1 mitochondrial DNA polymerase accessory subunit precursor [Xenopus laevis]AAI70142.1 Mitochondrial DNA polymerase accessory subunit precursor [Xenopus laevis]AAI70144.1 Mitochondrial DNA polymerase acce
MLLTLKNTGQLLVAACSKVARSLAKYHPRVNHHRHCVWCSKRGLTTGGTAQKQDILFHLCQQRHFLSGETLTCTSLVQGCHNLGPLGVELKRNLVAQWWNSVVVYREQVLGIDTLHHLSTPSSAPEKPLLAICTQHLKELPRDQLVKWLEDPAGKLEFLRHELLYGALLEYVPSMELLNKKMPFGLAEIGKCFHSIPEERNKGTILPRIGERTVASLVWFSSPKSSGQWQDYWLRQRLQWWQKFAQSPSGFSCNDIQDGQGRKSSLIQYEFPWGRETIETLCNMDDSALFQMHPGCTTKLQARDGRKSVVPHVVWVSGDLDRGILAYLSDALQQTEAPAVRGQYHQREVLKLHPTLAPIKVAVDMGKGPTGELRLVCQGLSSELREQGVYVWPGYQETLHGSLEQLYTKYDKMGVLFTVLVSESTLENGLLQVRSRDTTLKETIHVSKVKDFLVRYIAAAGNL